MATTDTTPRQSGTDAATDEVAALELAAAFEAVGYDAAVDVDADVIELPIAQLPLTLDEAQAVGRAGWTLDRLGGEVARYVPESAFPTEARR